MKAYPYEIHSKAVLKVPAGELMSRSGLHILLESMRFIEHRKSFVRYCWPALSSRMACHP